MTHMAEMYSAGAIVVNNHEWDTNLGGNEKSDRAAVATGLPQDESVPCADLWPVHLSAPFHTEEDGPQGRRSSGMTRMSRIIFL